MGGCAAFAGAGSPLTHAVGLGIGLDLTAGEWERELDRLAAFYRIHGASVALEVSTLADFHLLELLIRRGYRPSEWNHILWRGLERGEWLPATPRVEVRRARDVEAWARALAQGFFEREEVSEEELGIGLPLFHAAGARAYEALIDGAVAGCAVLTVRDGVALLHADSTLDRYRARGVQRALIRARLRDALDEGADLATAATLPGSVSQRNYERQGFQVVYARQALTLEG